MLPETVSERLQYPLHPRSLPAQSRQTLPRSLISTQKFHLSRLHFDSVQSVTEIMCESPHQCRRLPAPCRISYHITMCVHLQQYANSGTCHPH